MAKLKEELAEAKAITEREVSLRDGTCQHINKFIITLCCRLSLDVAYTEWLSDGCLLSYVLTRCSSLVSSSEFFFHRNGMKPPN